MMWAIYSRETDAPIWISEDSKDLIRNMLELKRSLGDRFYVDTYERQS